MNSKTYIAHRGWHNKYAPENSLEAFKQALEKNLAIEFDLQMTRDKQIVVFHDSNLKRMCGIDKSINSCAYEEIKNLKLKNSQETIPLLSDVLKLVNGKVLLDIEIKNTKYIFRSVDVISHILNNYQGPYTIKSFNPLISYIYKKKNPNISCGVLVGDLKNTKVPKFFQNTFLNIRYLPLYKPDFIAYSETTFYIETEEQDLSKIATDWINQYVGQYMQKYVPRLKKVKSIEIKNVEVLNQENQYVQIDFELKTTKKKSDYFLENDWGIYEENHILSCQWVLKFLLREENQISKYFVTARMKPVEYQIQQYKESGQAEAEQQQFQFENKKYYEDKEKQCTYKIENEKIYVTYDNSNTWKEVETNGIDFRDSSKKYKLTDNLYTISEEVTAIMNMDNQMIYSKDKGKTWKLKEYKGEGNSMYLQFLNANTGYLVEVVDAALGGERFIEILKTQDRGETWTSVGNGPNENGSIRDGAQFKMFGENVGFLVNPVSAGEKAILYKTTDGMKTFSEVQIPAQTLEDTTLNLNWQDVYDTPEMPYIDENNELILVVGQGSDGDYNGGTKSAYKSNDMGDTWTFIEEYMPEPEEWEG